MSKLLQKIFNFDLLLFEIYAQPNSSDSTLAKYSIEKEITVLSVVKLQHQLKSSYCRIDVEGFKFGSKNNYQEKSCFGNQYNGEN